MSHTAHIPSHRKPRRSASKLAVRAGVAGGVLSTLAMAGTASATPVEPVTETLEMPVLNLDLGSEVSSAVTTAADNSRAAAVEGELNAQEETARTGAAAEAKKAKEDAQKKLDAEKKAKAEEERKAAAERATRNDGRTSLAGTSTKAAKTTTVDEDGPSTPAATGSAAAIVAFARAQVGKPYVLGSTGPTAYDCSGLVRAAYKQANVSLPRMSQDQSLAGRSVSLSSLQPGDILYWGSKGSAYHVAVYVGGGKFVGAQNPRTGIVERSLSYDRPTGAVRLL
ncbi:glycoside hydrolase [Streptomyces venezuelae]|uniref:Glycoside hydrolase n=1 Tax=Streptomyces venezuelae TaxID=54571 RepID=A0A5P2D3B0_STRVZ|nr:C40 family peptidase [Streptomyces venezuelae]QES49576.1 glycoside hydrolase [Streptomyces venezuelae]